MGVRDFLTFFSGSRLEVRPPQPILTQNGSNDVDSRKDDTFAVKIATFHTPWSPGPLKGQKLKFLDLENFSLDLAFNIRGPESKHPLFFIRAQ